MNEDEFLKLLLCLGKSINDLNTSKEHLEYILDRSKSQYRKLGHKEIIKYTKLSEQVIKLNSNITKALMS